jgi:hypothetical protein
MGGGWLTAYFSRPVVRAFVLLMPIKAALSEFDLSRDVNSCEARFSKREGNSEERARAFYLVTLLP